MKDWGLADQFEYRGELDRAGKIAVPPEPRRDVGPRDVCGAERHLPARGDGHRRSGRAAPARRVSGDHRDAPAAA